MNNTKIFIKLKSFFILYKGYIYPNQRNTEMNKNSEEQQYDDEMLEMWLEKLNRQGRIQERNGEIITKEQLLKMMADDEM